MAQPAKETQTTPVTQQQSVATAEFLVSKGYLLTALEFLQECTERGEPIPTLEEYFMNDRFLPVVQDTKLSPRLAQFPTPNIKNEQDYQNKISVLEYDLRKERENLQILRQELQNILLTEKQKDLAGISNAPPSSLERNTLNYCVQQYLMDSGYKLSAISFSQEVSQDGVTTDWQRLSEMYGIKEFKLPPLRLLYHYFMSGTVNKHEFGLREALDSVMRENEQLKGEIYEVRQLFGDAQDQLEHTATANQRELDKYYQQLHLLNEENEKLKAELSKQVNGMPITQQRESQEQSALTPNNSSMYLQPQQSSQPQLPPVPPIHSSKIRGQIPPAPPKRGTPVSTMVSTVPLNTPLAAGRAGHLTTRKKYKHEGRNFAKLFEESPQISSPALPANQTPPPVEETLITQINSLQSIENLGHLISLMAKSLPKIVKGVIPQKRAELLPLILITICWSMDEKQRESLLEVLFNLIQRPTPEQRKCFIDGCVWLSTQSAPERTSTDIVAQCTEQVESEFEERRILIAELCGSLSQYMNPDLRLSLLKSILQQLSEDTSLAVRESVVKNLGKVLITAKDFNFSKLEDLVLLFFKEQNKEIHKVAKKYLLPSWADWCDHNNSLREPFAAHLVGKALHIVEDNSYISKYDQNVIISDTHRKDLKLYLGVLHLVIPYIADAMFREVPNSTAILAGGHDERISAAVETVLEEIPSITESIFAPIGSAFSENISASIMKKKKKKRRDEEGSSEESESDGEAKSGTGNSGISLASQGPPSVSLPAPATAPPPPPPRTTSSGITTGIPPPPPLEEPKEEDDIKLSHMPLFSASEKKILRLRLDRMLATDWNTLKEEFSQNSAQTKFPTLQWTWNVLLPKLIQFACVLDPVNKDVFVDVCRVFSTISSQIGSVFARIVLRDLFEKKLEEIRTALHNFDLATTSNSSGTSNVSSALANTTAAREETARVAKYANIVHARARITLLYLSSVLSTISPGIVENQLKDILVKVSLEEDHWKLLHYYATESSFLAICEIGHKWEERLLGVLWTLVVDKPTKTRAMIAKLFVKLAKEVLDERLIETRVVPALVTLSGDETNRTLRTAAFSALAEVAVFTTTPRIMDKIKFQLKTLLDNSPRKMQREAVRIFGKIAPEVSDDFRDNFILPEIYNFCKLNQATRKASKKKRMLVVLIPTIKTLSQCLLPASVKERYLLPSINLLQEDYNIMDQAERKVFSEMQEDTRPSIDFDRSSFTYQDPYSLGSAVGSGVGSSTHVGAGNYSLTGIGNNGTLGGDGGFGGFTIRFPFFQKPDGSN